MVTRLSIAFATLMALAPATVTPTSAITLQSQRRHISVAVTSPAGWKGPAYRAWPRYDTFSFSRGHEPAACNLQVRFDPATNEPGDRHSTGDAVIHWNSTPLDAIREQYKREFQHPRIERLTTITVAGEAVRIHAVYNADGDFYVGELLRAGTVINVELRCPSRHELQSCRQTFLTFMRSLRFSTRAI